MEKRAPDNQKGHYNLLKNHNGLTSNASVELCVLLSKWPQWNKVENLKLIQSAPLNKMDIPQTAGHTDHGSNGAVLALV